MAMTGKGATNWSGPSGWADRLSIIGAALKDASPESQGGNLLRVQSMLGGREQEAKKQEFLKTLGGKLGPQYADGSPSPTVTRRGMIGAQGALLDPSGAISEATNAMAPGPAEEAAAPYQYTPPARTSDGLRIDSPELPALALQAQQLGVPLTSVIDILKANQADMAQDSAGGFYNKHNPGLAGTRTANRVNVNDTIVDMNDPGNTNRVISGAPEKGAMPVYDNLGHVIDWSLPRGVREAMQTAAQARQTGQTFGTVYNRPDGEGHTSPTLGADMFGGGQGGSPAGGAGPGRTQSPAEAESAKIQAAAAAQAKVDLPKVLLNAQQSLDLLGKLKAHPSLGARTGMSGMLPAFAGTADAGFDTLAAQVKGKAFLEAYNGLRGAGAITENEGAAATAAIARLDRAQSAADYKAGLADLEAVITSGMARAKTQAAPAMPATSASSGPRTQGFRSRIIEVH